MRQWPRALPGTITWAPNPTASQTDRGRHLAVPGKRASPQHVYSHQSRAKCMLHASIARDGMNRGRQGSDACPTSQSHRHCFLVLDAPIGTCLEAPGLLLSPKGIRKLWRSSAAWDWCSRGKREGWVDDGGVAGTCTTWTW
jgi:hypothetical protein